jgi:transposase
VLTKAAVPFPNPAHQTGRAGFRKETAEAFRTSWDKVFDAAEHVVAYGLEHRVFGQINAIGIDEIQYAKGHKYLTLVYRIDLGATRLLWVGRERTIESFQGFFTVIGDELASEIVFVCSDMGEPYLKIIREKCSEALHILTAASILYCGEDEQGAG